jgi:hypothetical protein
VSVETLRQCVCVCGETFREEYVNNVFYNKVEASLVACTVIRCFPHSIAVLFCFVLFQMRFE